MRGVDRVDSIIRLTSQYAVCCSKEDATGKCKQIETGYYCKDCQCRNLCDVMLQSVPPAVKHMEGKLRSS
jgi:hypothetical protein